MNNIKRLVKKAMDIDPNGYLNDLLQVGRTKSLGYLPLKTITDKCNQKPENIIHFAEENNLKCLLLQPEECGISSGALYIYDETMLLAILNQYKDVLEKAGVPTDSCVDYIRYISNHTIFSEKYPKAYVAIGKTFNDPRFR